MLSSAVAGGGAVGGGAAVAGGCVAPAWLLEGGLLPKGQGFTPGHVQPWNTLPRVD